MSQVDKCRERLIDTICGWLGHRCSRGGAPILTMVISYAILRIVILYRTICIFASSILSGGSARDSHAYQPNLADRQKRVLSDAPRPSVADCRPADAAAAV